MLNWLVAGAFVVFFPGSAVAQESAPRPRIGVHFATDVTGGIDGFGENRLGAQAVLPLSQRTFLFSGLSWFFSEAQLNGSVPGGLRTTIHRWQTWVGVRMSPTGGVWYLGMGMSYLHASDKSIIDRSDGLQHFIQTGADVAVGPLNPFVEAQLHDVLNWGRLNLLGGLNIPIG